MAKLTTSQKIFWGIGVAVVAVISYKLITKPKEEPFVIDEDSSNVSGGSARRAGCGKPLCNGQCCGAGKICSDGFCV